LSSAAAAADGSDRVLQGVILGTGNVELLVHDSNRDFAFYCNYNGVQNFIPEHPGVGTVTQKVAPVYKIDGATLDFANLATCVFATCDSF
jgi:hypothetical protein